MVEDILERQERINVMELHEIRVSSYAFDLDGKRNWLYIKDGCDVNSLPSKVRKVLADSGTVEQGIVFVRLVLKECELIKKNGYLVIQHPHFEGDET